MLASFLRHPRCFKVITRFILVNFIFSGMFLRSSAFASADKLRPSAVGAVTEITDDLEKTVMNLKDNPAKYPGYLAYVQAEDTVYAVSGGSYFDKFVADVLAQAREAAQKPVLKVYAVKISDDVAQVVWQFAGKTIRRNFNLKGVAALVVDEFNNKVAPVFEENNFDLIQESDYQRPLEIIKDRRDLSITTYVFVRDELLPQIKEALSARKGTQKINGKPYVFLVTPNVFAQGGLKNILAKAAELNEIVNIKFAFYGDNAGNLRDILEIAKENIITAGDLPELLKEFANRNIEPVNVIALITAEEQQKEAGAALKQASIRQIVAPEITTLGAAKAIKELFANFDFVRSSFNGFMAVMLIDKKVISPVNSDEHLRIIGDLKEGAFIFSEQLQPIQEVSKAIEEAVNDEQYKQFVAKYL
jgi:hypothetical protein